MHIKLVGSGEQLEQLHQMVISSLTELGFIDVVIVETTDDVAYKMELGITQNPALCIEEETIEFKDMIFEGMLPEKEEIKSMFLSILGGGEMESGCCSSDACGSCGGGCH